MRPFPSRTIAAAPALAIFLAAPIAAAQDYCASCHAERPENALSEPVSMQADSAHGQAEMSCADCHGGAREISSIRAHDPERGFVARPDPQEIPVLCGSCHGDASRLGDAAGDLPTDQLERYRRSGHGRSLARGNMEAATCVDCHGAHHVADAAEQESLTHPENVAPTCGGCHSNPSAMTATGMPLNQHAQWRRSVHGRRFEGSESVDVPTCNGCHDAHGGITGIDDVAACGRCHRDQLASFQRSPHAEVFERLGFASCVDCHGSHDVRPAHANLIGTMRDSTCRLCHNEQQPLVFERIRRLGELRAAAALAERRGRVALEAVGGTPEAEDEAARIRAAFEEAAADLDEGLHSFDDAIVEQAVVRMTDAASQAVALRGATPEDEDPFSGLLILLGVVAVLATVGAVLVVRRRT